ncbi:pyridoxamine 5'-phosphate oxidase family protein [Spongiimicrobium salis]|uniref:pyridoxamine 5'-phosphate oxidase family protein n=1 Tax=Spongiimicrobium salis TaxID=1667022 RepID=UPI00374CD288
MGTVFNEGELKIQKQLGVADFAGKISKMITNKIIRGAIPFIEKQKMAVATTLDTAGNVWISLLVGDFGFTKVVNPSELYFDRAQIRSTPTDIFYSNILEIPKLGTLFIEFATRRRIRINGHVMMENDKISVHVEESYTNCPKYIQQREIELSDPHSGPKIEQRSGSVLTDSLKDLIQGADTLFVGSAGLDGKLDASHRGGPKGFVEIMEDDILKIPDYQGNNLYNTLGNLSENPKGGLLFIDFENKKTLQLTGEVSMAFHQNSQEELEKSTGTGRFWFFKINEWIATKNHHAVDWNFVSFSPFNP